MKNEFFINNIDYAFTDEELSLIFDTTIGNVFLEIGKIALLDNLLDYRLRVSSLLKELSNSEQDEIDRLLYEDEVKCVDLLLSVRNYYVDKQPDSILLEQPPPPPAK